MAKKVSKKVEKKSTKSSSKKSTRIKVWRYANFVLLMVSFIAFAEMIQSISIASVAGGVYKVVGENAEVVNMNIGAFTEVIIKSNLDMSKAVLVVSGSYALFHALNYFFYINKRKTWLIVALLCEVIVCALGIATDFNIGPFACGIAILPIISGLMYLRIMRLEEE